MNSYLIILIVSVMIASFAQVLLKKSAEKTYASPLREYLNLYVICGYGLMFLSMFMTIASYSGLDFTNVPVIESLGYVMVMFLSYFFFKEKITQKNTVAALNAKNPCPPEKNCGRTGTFYHVCFTAVLRTQTPYLLVATFTPTPIVEVTVQDFR